MDKKQIVAAILSVIGAGLIALFVGLGLYTLILLPAFIVVLVVNIWGGQRAKAVWLGFLLFLFYAIPKVFIFAGTILTLAILLAAFALLFSSYYIATSKPASVNRPLVIITALFFVFAAVVQIAVFHKGLDSYDSLMEGIGRGELLYWPGIIVHYGIPFILSLLFIILLLLENRFVYYLLTPIVLVFNLLYALNNILPFIHGKLYLDEIPRVSSMLLKTIFSLRYLPHDLFILLSIVMVVCFFRFYRSWGEEK